MTDPTPPRQTTPGTVAGMEWPARCLDCGLVTEDPDAYVLPEDWDNEYPHERACLVTSAEHRWATARQTTPDDPPMVRMSLAMLEHLVREATGGRGSVQHSIDSEGYVTALVIHAPPPEQHTEKRRRSR